MTTGSVAAGAAGAAGPLTGTEAPSPVRAYLESLHRRHAGVTEGEVATYIPELGHADPTWFGICMATVDGALYEVGDSRQQFTIQSISKPLTFGVVLDEYGQEPVRARIGVEPSGEPFNAITLAAQNGTPLNPMVNAGAIAAAGMVVTRHGSQAPGALLDAYARFAGRPLEVDEAVFGSERTTGHRNRAIGHLLRAAGTVEGEPDDTLDLYFRQCSVLVDARDLGVIAATLAAGGVNPFTGERAADDGTVRSVLSVMATCGMYDGAGEWLYTVGLPAKSGVAGGIIAVLPGQLGIGVFSPLLDPRGNSVRGVLVCQDMSRELDLHLIQSGRRPPSPIRATYTLAGVGSSGPAAAASDAEAETRGRHVAVLELQGEVTFAAAEVVTRKVMQLADQADIVVLDAGRAQELHHAVIPFVVALGAVAAARDGALIVTGVDQEPDLVEQLHAGADGSGRQPIRTFPNVDRALEWCECL